MLQAHHSTERKPLNRVRPDVPAELAAVVARMMAKDPSGGSRPRPKWPRR